MTATVETMRAVHVTAPGGPEVLKTVLLALPVPGPGQVRVRVAAIGVGTADQLVRTGRYPWMPALPAVPGIEASGIVDAVGPGPNRYKVGDRVAISAEHNRNCYAEFVVQDAAWVFPVPDKVDLVEAGCLATYRVAWHLLHTAARVRPGEWALIIGAAGGVGAALLQLCRDAGVRTVAAVRGELKADFANRIGADLVVDTRRFSLAEAVRDATGGGAAFVFDPVGGDQFTTHLGLLSAVGTLTLYGLIDGWPPENLLDPMRRRVAMSPAIRFFSLHSFDDKPAITAEVSERILTRMANGAIRVPIHQRLRLDEASVAHRALEEGKVVGKIVLVPE
ncbi:MAG: zinc-binding dehydrogenase [Burkholderiales bacterium]|nr:zinc-binding dehydrogenase [Burkholderiales bacterium]